MDHQTDSQKPLLQGYSCFLENGPRQHVKAGFAGVAVPAANAVAISLPSDFQATTVRAAWVVTPSDILKMLDAGFLVGVASEDAYQVHNGSPYELIIPNQSGLVRPITYNSVLLKVSFSSEYRDSVLELLWELDTLGIEEREEESRINLQSYFDSSRSVSRLRTVFEREAGRRQLVFKGLDVSLVDWSAEEWLISCKRHFRGVHVDETFYIHPPCEKPSESHPVNILIEVGRAFGTGTHESTQLCLVALSVMGKQVR